MATPTTPTIIEQQQQSLARWLISLGATGLENIALNIFPSTGRGIQTLKPLKKGDTVLSIPVSAVWSTQTALEDPALGPILSNLNPPLHTDNVLAVFLMYIKGIQLSSDSHSTEGNNFSGRVHHIPLLPPSYSTHSIFFTEEELNLCKGSSLHALTVTLEEQIKAEYDDLKKRVFEPYSDIFDKRACSLEEFKWALCTVWSRAMDFENVPITVEPAPSAEHNSKKKNKKKRDKSIQKAAAPTTSLRCIVPFADMFNHRSDVSTTERPATEQPCHAYDATSDKEPFIRIVAREDYHPEEQVFINYGAVSNSRLLRLYGFIKSNNPHNSYDLVLSTTAIAPQFPEKRALWESVGLSTMSTISLTESEPLPTKVLQYLRIQRLNAEEMELAMQKQIQQRLTGHSVGANLSERISLRNEVEVLRALEGAISDLLTSFHDREYLEERCALYRKTEGDGSTGSSTGLITWNAYAACQVGLEEQAILGLTLKKIQDLYAMLACAGCGMESIMTDIR
ncbi:hypothetical protein HK102_014086 [Quaeritorhiza haematococci]|nr:hypothetical protein HK102_014086 [Quaeritorhiza haematococci]